MATLAEDGALDYAAYEAPRRVLVSARNGALVRAGADPVEGSAVVAELARFDACVAVGEAVVGGGKVRVRLAAPVAGWASGRCFVEVRDAVGRDDWAATAARASSAAPGRVEILARDPLAFTIAGFASDAEVARVVAEASPRLGAALVAGDAAGEAAGSSRSARVAWLPRAPDAWLAARVAAILDLPVSHAESLQVVKYEAGGEYRPQIAEVRLDAVAPVARSSRGVRFEQAACIPCEQPVAGGHVGELRTPDDLVRSNAAQEHQRRGVVRGGRAGVVRDTRPVRAVRVVAVQGGHAMAACRVD